MADNVDVFLLVFVLIVIVGAVLANVRLLTYFQAPEARGAATSVVVKAVIIISLTLCWVLNILLPVDVRNSRPKPGPLDMELIWSLAFCTLAVFLILVVPAAMFYYEVEEDDDVKKKRRYVLCNMLFMLFFICGAIAISYTFLAEASLPIVRYTCSEGHWLDADSVGMSLANDVCSNSEDADLTFKVGIQVYLVAAMCFVGWVFFVTFGGIGLSAVPMDLILEYIDRPRPISEAAFSQERLECGAEAAELLQLAEKLTSEDTSLVGSNGFLGRRKKKKLQTKYNRFKCDVHFLEERWERARLSKFQKGESLAVSVAKLVLGIFFALLSILWLLHVILYVTVRKYVPDFPTTFLNALLEAFESPGLYPVGVALFATFNLYLLLCVVKGCMKFGLRIAIFFSIHPMRFQATPLNSILFNVLMLLISTASVVQFGTQAFADYARLTDADVIFSAQINHLAFYSFFFDNNIFIYTLLVWSVLTLIYLLCKGPRDSSSAKRRKRKGSGSKSSSSSKRRKKQTGRPAAAAPSGTETDLT